MRAVVHVERGEEQAASTSSPRSSNESARATKGRYIPHARIFYFAGDRSAFPSDISSRPRNLAYSTAGAFLREGGVTQGMHLCRSYAGTGDNCGLHGTTSPRRKLNSHITHVVCSCPLSTPAVGLPMQRAREAGRDAGPEAARR